MNHRTKIPAQLYRLSRTQAGVVSRQQTQKLGLTDRVVERLVREGSWRRVATGVYGLAPSTWEQTAWTGVLIGGRTAVLGGWAAAYLHGWVPAAPGPITIFVDRRFDLRHDPRWRFIRSARSGRGRPPRTNAEQTILDLAPGSDSITLATLIWTAAAAGTLKLARLDRLIAATERISNRRNLVEALALLTPGLTNPLVTKYVREVELAHGLPLAVRQIAPAADVCADNQYSDFNLHVRLDAVAPNRSRRTTAPHLADSPPTMCFGWQAVSADPCLVARQIATALRRQGWTDEFRRCPHCRSRSAAWSRSASGGLQQPKLSAAENGQQQEVPPSLQVTEAENPVSV